MTYLVILWFEGWLLYKKIDKIKRRYICISQNKTGTKSKSCRESIHTLWQNGHEIVGFMRYIVDMYLITFKRNGTLIQECWTWAGWFTLKVINKFIRTELSELTPNLNNYQFCNKVALAISEGKEWAQKLDSVNFSNNSLYLKTSEVYIEVPWTVCLLYIMDIQGICGEECQTTEFSPK